MTGLLLGTLAGIGLFLVWASMWAPQADDRVSPSRRGQVGDRVRDELVQAGFAGTGPLTLVVGCFTSGVLVFAVGYAVASVIPIAVAFGLLAAYAPVALVRSRARNRRAVLRDLWPDAVDNITSGVRAGLALPEALSQLSIRGPAELRPAFADFAEDYRATGRFHECLDALKERLSDPVGDRLIESLRIAREVGGSDLGRLLRTLSTFLRDDARTRAELETRQGWTVNAARLAAAAPWLILVLLSLRGEALDAYATPTGWAVLLVGGLVTLAAYRVMVFLGRLPEDERVLR